MKPPIDIDNDNTPVKPVKKPWYKRHWKKIGIAVLSGAAAIAFAVATAGFGLIPIAIGLGITAGTGTVTVGIGVGIAISEQCHNDNSEPPPNEGNKATSATPPKTITQESPPTDPEINQTTETGNISPAPPSKPKPDHIQADRTETTSTINTTTNEQEPTQNPAKKTPPEAEKPKLSTVVINGQLGSVNNDLSKPKMKTRINDITFTNQLDKENHKPKGSRQRVVISSTVNLTGLGCSPIKK